MNKEKRGWFSEKELRYRFASLLFYVFGSRAAYFGLFILMPILNAGINALTEKQATLTAALLFLVFSVLKTASSVNANPNIFNLNSGYAVLWLCIVYIIGGCIGKYDMLKKFRPIYFILGYVAVTVFALGFKLVAERKDFGVPSNTFINYLSPTVLLAAVCLLGLFSRLKTGAVTEKNHRFFCTCSIRCIPYSRASACESEYYDGKICISCR